jgi:hypothetical protein
MSEKSGRTIWKEYHESIEKQDKDRPVERDRSYRDKKSDDKKSDDKRSGKR